MKFPRTSGILLHPTSFPSAHGVGDLGPEARRFVDWLVSAEGQKAITDYRINVTLHKLDRIMDGELDELLDALAAEHLSEQLTQLAEETA